MGQRIVCWVVLAGWLAGCQHAGELPAGRATRPRALTAAVAPAVGSNPLTRDGAATVPVAVPPGTGTQPLYASDEAGATDGGTFGNFRFSLEGSYLYGPVRGSVQTPSGGEPGTTSPKRPRFSEIGINDANVGDAALAVSSGNHGVYVGAQFIELSGTRTLGSELVSQANTFSAGTRVNSDVSLDWYRVGYRYRWVVEQGPGDRPEWTLYPSIGGALFTFDYKLNDAAGDGGPRVSRSYSKALPQVGLEAEWRPGGGPFAVSAGALGFPAIGTVTPEIATERLLLKYQFVRQPRVDVEGAVGVQFEQFYYRDSQTVPNRVEANLGPMLVVGLRIDF